jgi:malate dehydrogenase (oxaloacetate-decarboxylating)(NADP+)
MQIALRALRAWGVQKDGPLMTKTKITPEEALAYHLEPRPGKYDVVASTPMATQRDLSLA